MKRTRRKGSGIGHGISGARANAHAARADESGCRGRGGDPGGFPLREEKFGKCGKAGSWGRPRIGLGAIAFCVLAATSSSFPAGAADDVGEAREVVSVGSLMSTGAVRDMQPITVIEREEIELSGMRNLWDFLAGRLDYNSFGLERPFMLGGFRLAVLIDGRSISDSTFDLDSLPVSAVERIEVLSDSAVALYGPQAIAGAINIVLRDHFEGTEVQVGVEHPVRGGGETEHVSALWGGAVGAGHLDLGVDLFRRNEIRASQRRYSRASWTPGGSFADTAGVSVFGNTAFYFTSQGLRARSLGDCEGEGFTGPLGDPYGIPGEGCGYAYGDVAWSWERRDRDTLFLGLDHPLGEDHSAYFDARLAQSDFMLPPRWAPVLAVLPPTSALPALVFHRFAGHGHREWRADSKEHDLTLGLEGEVVAGIGYDAHLRSYGHDEYREAGTFVQKSVFEHALAAGAYDLLDPLSTDPAHLEAIRKSSVYQERDRILEHRVVRVAFDGQGPTLGGRALGWAAGAEFAYEKRTRDAVYRSAAGDEVPQDDVIGWFDFSFDGERERLSKFAELSIPLQQRWDVVLSGRHDDHDDVESTISRQAATRFRLNEGVSLRGSWSKAARAPGIGALHTARIITRPTISDPQTGYRYPITAVNSGNPELEPSRAESFGLGIVSEMGPVTLSADWYRMDLSRLLTIYYAQQLLYLEDRDALPEGVRIERDPQTGLITRIIKPVTGSGKLDVSGIHFRAQADWKTDWADFELDAWWSHLLRYHARAPGVEEPDYLPRNRAHLVLRARRDDVTAQWSAYGLSNRPNYWSSGSYPGWVGHDLSVRWEDALGIGGADVVGGILNVADREPSADPLDPGYPDETLDSIRGRTLFVSVTKTW